MIRKRGKRSGKTGKKKSSNTAPPTRTKSVSKLKKELDRCFSLYIRKRDSGVCFTCGTKNAIKRMQAGHYVSRGHNNLRYDEQNVHCQCLSCNVFRHGNMDVYAIKLQETYGRGILKKLHEKKRVLKQFTPQELESLIEYYIMKGGYEQS